MSTADKIGDLGIISDDELIQGFEQATLKSFHHADHVRVAFAYLCRYPATEALEKFSTALRRFAEAQGKPKLYHETITWAYLLLIRERMARGGTAQAWDEFARENSDLLAWKPGILAHYYRQETLASELARTTFIFPDKCS
jgi:uncharacterized Zn finger protein